MEYYVEIDNSNKYYGGHDEEIIRRKNVAFSDTGMGLWEHITEIGSQMS